MASVPVISSLQTLSAAKALPAMASSEITASERMTFMIDSKRWLMRYAQPLLHQRTRGRVLQELLLGRVKVVLDGEGRESGLVESCLLYTSPSPRDS